MQIDDRMTRAYLRGPPQHPRGFGSDLRGRAIGVVNESRNRLPAHRLDADLHLLRVGEQGGVFHRPIEGVAQRLDAILRYARRRADRAFEIEPAEDQAENLARL